MHHLQMCRGLGTKLVIGTTGFTEAQKAEIAEAAKDIAIVKEGWNKALAFRDKLFFEALDLLPLLWSKIIFNNSHL